MNDVKYSIHFSISDLNGAVGFNLQPRSRFKLAWVGIMGQVGFGSDVWAQIFDASSHGSRQSSNESVCEAYKNVCVRLEPEPVFFFN